MDLHTGPLIMGIIARLFLERAGQFLTHGVPPDWTAVERITWK